MAIYMDFVKGFTPWLSFHNYQAAPFGVGLLRVDRASEEIDLVLGLTRLGPRYLGLIYWAQLNWARGGL